MQTIKKLKPVRNNKFLLFSLCLLLLLFSLPKVAKADVDMTADYIKYNIVDSTGNARGNVHITRGEDYINGDELFADFKNGNYTMERNIDGFIAKHGLYLFGDHMYWSHTDENDIINLQGNARFERDVTAKDYDNPNTTKLYTDVITCANATLDAKLEKLVLVGPVAANIVSQRTKIFGDKVVWEQSGDDKLTVNGRVRVERIAERASAKGKKKPLVTDVLTANTAYYLTEKDFIHMEGNVRGTIPSQEATSSCNVLTWQKEANHSIVEMNGAARLIRFQGREKLSADRAKYIESNEGYELENGVEILTETRHINCDKFLKHGKYFKGFNITRFEETKQKYNARGKKLVGTMIKNEKTNDDEIDTATVMGDVYFEFTDNQNHKTVSTGEQAVYSRADNMVTLTGNPRATRSDGKKINADRFRVNLATKIYYAEGNAHLVYIKEEKKEDATNKNEPKAKHEQKPAGEQQRLEKTNEKVGMKINN